VRQERQVAVLRVAGQSRHPMVASRRCNVHGTSAFAGP
jgi:hypothetical protein